MNPELRALYQEMILDHGRRPRHFGAPAQFTHKLEAFNPLCGDHLTLYATIENGELKNVQFDGKGCAISVASASMMCEEVEGKSCANSRGIIRALSPDGDGTEGARQYRQNGNARRRQRFSGAREMRDTGVAYARSHAERRSSSTEEPVSTE